MGSLSTRKAAAPGSVYDREESVKLESLDHRLASDDTKGRNSLLKIDVPGFEDQDLAGGEKYLKRIEGVKIELTLFHLYSEQSILGELIESFEEFRFILWNLEHGFSDENLGQTFQYETALNHASLVK